MANISTVIGAVTLTENQRMQWSVLNSNGQTGIWIRFTYIDGVVTGISATNPQQSDIDSLVTQINSLPDTPVGVFDPIQFQQDLLTAYVDNQFSNIGLDSKFAALNTCAINGDFEGMAQYLNFLLSKSVITQSDFNIVNNILKSYNCGIDLTTYQS